MERANDSALPWVHSPGLLQPAPAGKRLSLWSSDHLLLELLGQWHHYTFVNDGSSPPHPWHFNFLSNLSFMDLCLTTCTGPQTLASFKGEGQDHHLWQLCDPALRTCRTWGSKVCPPVCHGLWPVCSCVPSLHYMVIMHPQLCLQLVVTFLAYGLWQFCSPDSTDHDSSPLW